MPFIISDFILFLGFFFLSSCGVLECFTTSTTQLPLRAITHTRSYAGDNRSANNLPSHTSLTRHSSSRYHVHSIVIYSPSHVFPHCSVHPTSVIHTITSRQLYTYIYTTSTHPYEPTHSPYTFFRLLAFKSLRFLSSLVPLAVPSYYTHPSRPHIHTFLHTPSFLLTFKIPKNPKEFGACTRSVPSITKDLDVALADGVDNAECGQAKRHMQVSAAAVTRGQGRTANDSTEQQRQHDWSEPYPYTAKTAQQMYGGSYQAAKP